MRSNVVLSNFAAFYCYISVSINQFEQYFPVRNMVETEPYLVQNTHDHYYYIAKYQNLRNKTHLAGRLRLNWLESSLWRSSCFCAVKSPEARRCCPKWRPGRRARTHRPARCSSCRWRRSCSSYPRTRPASPAPTRSGSSCCHDPLRTLTTRLPPPLTPIQHMFLLWISL